MRDLILRLSVWLSNVPDRLIAKNEQIKNDVTPEEKAKRKRIGKIGYSVSAGFVVLAGLLYGATFLFN